MKLVKIGVITSAHGIRGQVKIHSFTGDPADLLTAGKLTDALGKRNFILKKQGVKDQLMIVSIDGIDDRNQAELLKGTELFAPAPAASTAESDRWSYNELTGLEAQLDNGAAYGKVIGVYNFGAGDILEIGLAGGKSEMLPLTQQFVGEVNVPAGFVIVFPPDYVETDGEP